MRKPWHAALGAILSVWGCVACGSPAAAAPPASPVPPLSSAAPSNVAAPSASLSSAAPSAAAATSASSGAAVATPAASAPPDAAGSQAASPSAAAAPRNKLYRVTSGKNELKIEIAGVRFSARAHAVRRGRGWGVSVRVVARSSDGQTHQLLSPKRGPLSFAGRVERAGHNERFSDQRQGHATQSLEAHKKVALERVWPSGSKVKPLGAGQTLDLQVGLWGFGDDASSLRPIKEFFEVKAVAGRRGKPTLKIAPPASAE